MMLITAVVASAILITAVFPIVWTMVSTFASASHDTDARMRTDFKIVTTFANSTPSGGWARVWLKNIGTSRIGTSEIDQSDVFIGIVGNFNRATTLVPSPSADGEWTYHFYDTNSNNVWDSGETLEVVAFSSKFKPAPDDQSVYFQFVLPNGVTRSSEFTRS
jgi:flagellar protein FlaG